MPGSADLKKEFDALRRRVLEDAKPSKDEIKRSTIIANQIMKRLKDAAPRSVEIILAGSVARGTQVRGSSDIDIFLLFPKSLDERKMEFKGIDIAKSIINKKSNESFVIKYAEHPYIQLMFNDLGINVDIVPAYKISNASELGSAVDRTQLHNEFVNNNLTSYQKDDVRVLKTFLKEHNIYGAEAMVEGFSGYLCELLIYHYGSFFNLISKIAYAVPPIAIIAKNRESLGRTASIEYMKRFGSSLIVIDPTDSNRNVAANVSVESLARLAISARKLLNNPSMSSFLSARFSDVNSHSKLSGIAKRLGLDIYVISMKASDIADDIIWQQTKKLRLRLGTLLSKNGFMPVISLQGISTKKALIVFFINKVNSGASVQEGPSAFMKDAAERFIKAHGDALLSISNDRLYAVTNTAYSNPMELLNAFIKSKSEQFPSYISKKSAHVYRNMLSEDDSKIIYRALVEKFSF